VAKRTYGLRQYLLCLPRSCHKWNKPRASTPVVYRTSRSVDGWTPTCADAFPATTPRGSQGSLVPCSVHPLRPRTLDRLWLPARITTRSQFRTARENGRRIFSHVLDLPSSLPWNGSSEIPCASYTPEQEPRDVGTWNRWSPSDGPGWVGAPKACEPRRHVLYTSPFTGVW
jgi:hypothetical protein